MAKQQKEFNSDMDDYIAKRRGYSGAFRFFSVERYFSRSSSSGRVPRVNAIETTVVDHRPVKRSWLSRLFGSSKPKLDDEDIDDLPASVHDEVVEMEEDIQEIDQEIHELENQRDSLLSRFFSLLRGKRKSKQKEDIDPEMVAHAIGDHARNEALISDTRAVLRSLHYWLGKLPPQQIDAFKRSPEFERYKDLLDKYGLIK